MTKLFRLTLVLFLSLSTGMIAQNIKGVATYKSQRKIDIKLDSTMADEMQNQIRAMLKKQMEKEFTLEFTNNESIYKEVESLDVPKPQMGGVNMVVEVVGSGESDILYKNTAETRFANQTNFFGKQFLVKGELSEKEWELTKETKNIGNYTCFKATRTMERTMISSVSVSENDDEKDSKNEKKEETTLVAWYTPQIPVKNGPGNYGGLPGLILEVNDGQETILCSKIVLNPKNGLDLKEPTKGKEVTKEKFDAIVEKKMKEMEEQFHDGDGRRNGGNSMQIEIRG